MEKIMRKFCLNRNSYEYMVLIQTYYFWYLVDRLQMSNKATIYKYLYLTPSCFNDTYLKISLKFGISLRTLERYRKEFGSSFAFISEIIANIKELSDVI